MTRTSTSPSTQSSPPRRTTRGWVWRLMRGTNEVAKDLPHQTHQHLGMRTRCGVRSLIIFGYPRIPHSVFLFPLSVSFTLFTLVRSEDHRVYIEALPLRR